MKELEIRNLSFHHKLFIPYPDRFKSYFNQLNGVSFTETDDRIAESADRDDTARMCSLILLYTLRKINPLSQTTG